MADPYYAVELSAGSYDLYRIEWDATGPLTRDGYFDYRVSGAYQDNESFRDFVTGKRFLINPTVTWRPTASTEVIFDVEYQTAERLADYGIPVIGARPAPIPISRNLGDPNTPIGDQENLMIGFEFNQGLGGNWAVHPRFLYTETDGVNTFVNPAPAFDAAAALDEATGIMQRNIFQQQSHQEVYSANLDLTGKVALGITAHHLLVGMDYFHTHNLYGSDGQWVAPDPALAINIFNPGPSYGIPPPVFAAALSTSSTPTPRSDIYNQWYGFYLQDQIDIAADWHLLLGGRYDWAETGRGRATSFAAATQALFHSTPSLIRDDEGFSPRVGLLYELTDAASVYATWTTSFGANNGQASNGATFDPQVGKQYEAGLKAALFDDRLLVTLAAYQLTKDNILVPNLNTADPDDRIANRQGSQGFEVDVSGRITRYLSVIASYAYTSTEVIEDHGAGSPNEGNRLANVPLHSGSVFMKYDLGGVGGKDISVGGGVYMVDERQVDLENTAQLPGYARVDAFVAYDGWRLFGARLGAQLNVRNLFDTEYFESTDPNFDVAPRLGVYSGAPLTVIGSIRLDY